MKLNNDRIRVLAMKKAKQGADEYVVRMVEMDGKPASNVHASFFAPLTSAREVTGAEEAMGAATVTSGELATSFKAFQPRSFAVKFASTQNKLRPIQAQPVKLDYDLCISTPDGRPGAGSFDTQTWRSLPAEMLPSTIPFAGIEFKVVSGSDAGYGKHNAVIPRGQKISLPGGDFNRIYVLAAATSGNNANNADVTATFLAGDTPVLRSRIGPVTSASGTTASGTSVRNRPEEVGAAALRPSRKWSG